MSDLQLLVYDDDQFVDVAEEIHVLSVWRWLLLDFAQKQETHEKTTKCQYIN